MPHVAINPTTGETIARHEELSAAELRRAIAETRRAWVGWQAVPFAARGELLRGAARVLRSRSTMLAQLMAREMGKPVREGRSEVEKCAWVCEYYAEHGDLFLDPEVVATDAGRSYVAYRPLGIVFAVMPWNFPFWQVFRFAAPVLMGGNVRVTRAPSAGKSIQVTVKGVSREAERLTFQLDGGRVLQLSTPPELPSPVAAGDALVLEILAHGGGPNRRHHVVARSPEGELVFEVGSSSSKAKDFSVTRGAERMAQPEGDRVRHDYRVRFEHAGSSVEVEPGSFSRLDAKYVVWGSATRQELGKGKKRPPDFVESWLDFAVFRLP